MSLYVKFNMQGAMNQLLLDHFDLMKYEFLVAFSV